MTISIRNYSDDELNMYPARFTNHYRAACTLMKAANELDGQLRPDGLHVDGCDILRALAAGLLEGDTEAINGKPQVGLFATLLRIAPILGKQNPRWFLTRYTHLGKDGRNGFGYQGRACYVPAQVTDSRVSFFPDVLFDPDFEEAFRKAYIQSWRCRGEDVKEHLSILRGTYILERFSLFKPSNAEVEKDDRVFKGSLYAISLANAFEKDPELLKAHLINDIKRSDASYHEPIPLTTHNLTQAVIEEGKANPILAIWCVVTRLYENSLAPA